jgi:hypothetical protein
MKRYAGLWIDLQEAVIVLISDDGQDIRHIKSHLEKQVHLSSETRLDPVEAARERRFTNHLNDYYDEVISHIRSANSIMLFGPGETTIEFKNRLESQDLGGYIVGLETVGKLSDYQIATKVQQHFQA